MSIQLMEISESDFKKLDLPVIFEDKSTDRVFGIVSNEESKYKLGWRSTNIKPIITLINSILCSIGVDLTFVIFDFDKGEVLIKLSLDYPFYDTKTYNGFLYVVTELEIIKVDITTITVSEVYALPDYFESIQFKDGAVAVKCISNEIINIE